MPYFGDIFLPWLTSKDTSISKDVVEKNFVDEPPQVFELTPDLEAGTYSIILNEEYSDKDESFEEQEDAVLSMVSRHGTEFPFESAGDSGYALIESANVTTFPSLEIREGEIELRFLDDNVYYSAVKAIPESFYGGAFETEASPVESFVAFPSELNILNQTEDYQITTSEGDLSLYTYTDKTIFEFEEDSNDQVLSQSESLCRLYNSSDERLYSDRKVVDNGSYINNSLIETSFESDRSTVRNYDGSWETIGHISLPYDDGYGAENENDVVSVECINGNTQTVQRGFNVVEYEFSGETSFDFTATNSFTNVSNNTYYSHHNDANNNDIIIVRTSGDGSFYTDTSDFGIQNLTSSVDYTVFLGVVPSGITVDDYARYVYNMGRRQRTFTQQ